MHNQRLNTRLEGADVLRGVAIIMVVIYHFVYRFDPEYLLFDWPALEKQPLWLGVDLFFIVSGFCIAFTLARATSLSAFWAARFSRIQPAYMAGVATTFAVVAWFGLPGREVGGLEALGNLVWLNATGAVDHVDGVYWSLVVELQFYVMVGLIWTVAPDGRSMTLAWAAACLVSIGMLDIHGGVSYQLLLYPFNVFFLMGFVLFNLRALSLPELSICLATFALGVATASRYEGVWLEVTALVALATVLIHVRRLPGFRWLAAIGVVSFSWYLLHQNIGVVIIRALNEAGMTAISIPAAIIGTLALAALFHAVFETAARRPADRVAAAVFRAARVDALAGLATAGVRIAARGRDFLAARVAVKV